MEEQQAHDRAGYPNAPVANDRQGGGRMVANRNRNWIVRTLTSLTLCLVASAWAYAFFGGGGGDVWGPRYNGGRGAPGRPPRSGGDAVRDWNQIAINATGLDHTPVAPG